MELSPNLPRMGTIDVRFAIDVPERLSVVTSKVEMDCIRPRGVIVRVLPLEDNLQQHVSISISPGKTPLEPYIIPATLIGLRTVIIHKRRNQPKGTIVES